MANFTDQLKKWGKRIAAFLHVEAVLSLASQLSTSNTIGGMIVLALWGGLVWFSTHLWWASVPLTVIAGSVFIIAAYCDQKRLKSKAETKSLEAIPAYDRSDIERYGRELASFADNVMKEYRHAIKDYPPYTPSADTTDGRDEWAYDRQREKDLAGQMAASYMGKCMAHLHRLQSYGIKINRDHMWHMHGEIGPLLLLLSRFGHILADGGLKELLDLREDFYRNLFMETRQMLGN